MAYVAVNCAAEYPYFGGVIGIYHSLERAKEAVFEESVKFSEPDKWQFFEWSQDKDNHWYSIPHEKECGVYLVQEVEYEFSI